LERSLPSVFGQTYKHFEIVVVGDACAEEHVQKIESWIKAKNDPRIRFYNLPVRGSYPSDPFRRWGVAGVVPRNRAIELAKGEWLALLDDDDEFSEDHIESLLEFARCGKYEFVYGAVQHEMKDGSWMVLGSAPLREGEICHLSVLYHRRLSFLRYDVSSWKYDEPADWNMWRRMREAGAKIGFLDRVIGVHYRGSSGFGK
jgi:glycosyltransferase involved in cell wall biosynthesis